MSGHSYMQNCPRCGKEGDAYDETRRLYFCFECLECGHSVATTELQMSLSEVNEIRNDRGLKPLKKLRSIK